MKIHLFAGPTSSGIDTSAEQSALFVEVFAVGFGPSLVTLHGIPELLAVSHLVFNGGPQAVSFFAAEVSNPPDREVEYSYSRVSPTEYDGPDSIVPLLVAGFVTDMVVCSRREALVEEVGP